MKKVIFLVLAWFFFLSMWSSTAVAAPTFWFDVKGITDKDATAPPGPGDGIPDTKVHLKPCEKVWIDILISGVPTGDKPGWGLVSIGSLDIFYDPKSFTWEQGVHPSMDMDDENWPFMQKEEWVEPGHLHMEGGASLGTGHYGDDIEVALIAFHCAGPPFGEYPIRLEYSMMYLLDGTEISGITEYIPLTINQVPIPTTLLLLGSGIIGVIGLRRKIQG